MGGQLDIAFYIFATDHIQNDVGPMAIGRLADNLDKILAAVVDRPLGTQFLACPAFFLVAGSHEYPRAKRAGDLNRRGANAGRAAMNQQYFSGLQLRTVNQVAPHGKKRLR